MSLSFTTRPSDSPWVDSIWTCRSDQVSEMTSVASHTWGLVFWRQLDRDFAAVTGPESRTSTAPVPEGAEFVGVQLAVGTSLRDLATGDLMDSGIDLPDVSRRGFWLDGRRWEIPDPDDVESLVARLVATDTLVRDPLVAETLRDERPPLSSRTLERRFRAATGFTRGALHQIERVRSAAQSLAFGVPVDTVVESSGYYDEPHLARALRRYVGRTAGQLRRNDAGTIALDLAHRATS